MTTPQPPSIPPRPARPQRPATPIAQPQPGVPAPRRGTPPIPSASPQQPGVMPAQSPGMGHGQAGMRPMQTGMPPAQRGVAPGQFGAPRLGTPAVMPGPVEPRVSRATTALSRSRAWARPARTGARLLAYTIDVCAVAIVAVLVGVLTRSLLLGGLAAFELVVVLLVLEARTGLTLGNLLMRMRTTRDDAPFSPGIARATVRGLVQGAGSLVALIGGWVVVATGASDSLRAGRSIADRAGRTLVVKVPNRAEREEWARSASLWALNAPHVGDAAPARTAGDAPAQIVERQPPLRQRAPVPGIGLQTAVSQRTDQPDTGRPDAARLPEGVVSVDAPIATPPVRNVVVGEQLLLSFDTGQREQLPTPLSVNLGRKPERSEEDDLLVVVRDPEGSVSKTHLRIEFRGGSVWLTDQGSTNGTEIFDDSGEGAVLDAGARVRLEEGSRVRIGSRSFTVATVIGETVR